MDYLFYFQQYLDETDLSWLEGLDKETLILDNNKAKVEGETLVLKEEN